MFNQNELLKHVMQARPKGYERKDKQAQNNVFKGDHITFILETWGYDQDFIDNT